MVASCKRARCEILLIPQSIVNTRRPSAGTRALLLSVRQSLDPAILSAQKAKLDELMGGWHNATASAR